MIDRLLHSVMPTIAVILVWVPAIKASAEVDGEAFFEKSVRPVLISRCLDCHGGEKVSGGLRIDSRESLLKGGDSGPSIVPGDAGKSLLVQAIERHEDVSAMPPETPLEAGQIQAIRSWVSDGAIWPKARSFSDQEHWAFEPLRDPPLPPGSRGLSIGEENPIDAFLQPVLESKGLVPVGQAAPRELLRRITYDLIGLPPSFEDVEDFERDPHPDALARNADRLLASSAYGERWGKHWLDVVRYADTAGDNTDRPLPHAWRYRNWVIQAFNEDLPYDEFLQEQLSGDIRANPSQPEEYANGIVATGFLSLARRFDHDADKFMHLTFEDAIDTMGKSLLGLTLGCARCHSHKYDPVSISDYYALYGILESSKFSFSGCEAKPKPRDLVSTLSPSERQRRQGERDDQIAKYQAEVRDLEERFASCVESLTAVVTQSTQQLLSGTVPDASISSDELDPIVVEQLQVEPGQLLLWSVHPRGNHGADSTRVTLRIERVDGSPQQWDLVHDVVDNFLTGNPHGTSNNNDAVWCFFDARNGLRLLEEPVEQLSGQEGLDVWRNGETPSAFVNAREEAIEVWTSLPPRSLFVHPGPDGPVAVGWVSPTSGLVRITAKIADAHPGGDGVDWSLQLITQNIASEIARQSTIAKQLTAAKRTQAAGLADLPKEEWAFAVVEGTFANARIQERGDPEQLGAEVPRRWLDMFGGEEVQSGSGRQDLARWITDPDNPLTYRVMANRIWQHHFGRGIVTTPNDFGTRGAVPSHPDLLDWLAREFQRSDLSIKSMHRLIMNSAAYQRSSLLAESESIRQTDVDPDNATLWRFSRRRLSAEEIRDSLLLASGDLDLSTSDEHPFPPSDTWKYTQHQPFADVYQTSHRSVFLMIPRNRRHPFLGLFDGADPNASTPQRSITTVPTQALFFMNDPLLHRSAEHLARRYHHLQGDEKIVAMFQTVLQRTPTDIERQRLSQARQEWTLAAPDDPGGWAAVGRLLLCTNEFLYVD